MQPLRMKANIPLSVVGVLLLVNQMTGDYEANRRNGGIADILVQIKISEAHRAHTAMQAKIRYRYERLGATAERRGQVRAAPETSNLVSSLEIR
jgi:hypothetical protein